jgi:4-hydroxy-3-polyprenylbenzoate decarboxylase
MKHAVVAISGASGVCYGLRILRVLHEHGVDTSVIVSKGGARVLEIEEGVRVDPEAPDLDALLGRPLAEAPEGAGLVRALPLGDIAAGICSGTHPVDGMVVAPCSMGTLARIAQGTSSNVLERSADVMLKERRPLVLVPREAPLSRIHLTNMLALHDAGAVLVPASPGFYHRPDSIDALVDQLVTKTLDQLGVRLDLIRRWKTGG